MEIFVNYIKSIKETSNAWGETILQDLPKINTSKYKINIEKMTLKNLLYALRFTIPIKEISNVELKHEDGYTVFINTLNEYGDCEKHYFIFHTLSDDTKNDCIITNIEKYRNGSLIRNYDFSFNDFIFSEKVLPEEVLNQSGVIDFIDEPRDFTLSFAKNVFLLCKNNLEYRVYYKGYVRI